MQQSTDDKRKVMAALSNDNYTWRTIGGIATEAGLSADKVLAILSQQPDEVVRSTLPSTDGSVLFAAREHLLKKQSVGDKLLGAIKNRLY